MKQGTMSVLLGCHSVMHSCVVILAWKHLYGSFPSGWETICILLHDIGHWGKDYLDNVEDKRQHAILGAKVAGRLFGQKGYELIVGHNPYISNYRSRLFEPDKHSWLIAPKWWMWMNTVFEPKLIRPGYSRLESVNMFKEAMLENSQQGYKKQGHDIYLEQWQKAKEAAND